MGWGRLWGPDPVVVGGLPDGDVVEVVVVVVGRGRGRRGHVTGDQRREGRAVDLVRRVRAGVDLEGVDEGGSGQVGRPPRGDTPAVVAAEVDLGDGDPDPGGGHRSEVQLQLVGPVLAHHGGHGGPTRRPVDRDGVVP